MLASMYGLDHRLNELRPSERDQELARRLRDAAATSRTVVRTLRTTAGQRLAPAPFAASRRRFAAG